MKQQNEVTMTAQQFMDNWNCTECGGVGYTYPGEWPCVACINAGNEYRRLRALELPPVAAIPGAIIPSGRRVVHVQRLDGTIETDAEWWARQAELEELRLTQEAASYRGQS